MVSVADYFEHHRIDPWQHPYTYSRVDASTLTQIPPAFRPPSSGHIVTFRYVPLGHVDNPLTALVDVLRRRHFDINATISDRVAMDLVDTNRRAASVTLAGETTSYPHFLSGFGNPASRIVNDQNLGLVEWVTSGALGVSSVVPDLEVQVTSTPDRPSAQAEIKPNERLPEECGDTIVATASLLAGLQLRYNNGPVMFESNIEGGNTSASINKVLAQAYFQMQNRGVDYEILTTWDWLVALYQPDGMGPVYVSQIIKRDFPPPAGRGLEDFIQTPLGVWTALACVPTPAERAKVRRLTVTSVPIIKETSTLTGLGPSAAKSDPPSRRSLPRQAKASGTRSGASNKDSMDMGRPPYELGSTRVTVTYSNDTDFEKALHSLVYINTLSSPFFGPYGTASSPSLFSKPKMAEAELPVLRPCTLNLPSRDTSLRLSLGSHVRTGRAWDVYRGIVMSSMGSTSHFSFCSDDTPPEPDSPGQLVIVKFTCPRQFNGEWKGESLGYVYSEVDLRKAVLREKRVYDVLRDDQGVVVPKYMGLYGSIQDNEGEEAWITVMEDAGHPIEDVTEDDRQVILSHYSSLHARGILHNDVEPKHWLVQPNSGKIKIIDFEGSRIRQQPVVGDRAEWKLNRPSPIRFASEETMTPLEWDEALREEMTTVERCLDEMMGRIRYSVAGS